MAYPKYASRTSWRAASSAGVPLAATRPFDSTIAVMRDRKRLVHVLLDQKHGDAALVDAADDVEILLHQARRQPERRLVDQQQLWRAHQPAADRYHRLLAAGHGAGKLRAPLGKPRKNLEDFGHARRASPYPIVS